MPGYCIAGSPRIRVKLRPFPPVVQAEILILNPEAGETEADAELVRRVAKGDRAAFGIVFDRYAAPALRYARRLIRDPAAGEDAVHAAFVRLLEAARSGAIDPGRGTLRGLLFRTVRNLCIDAIRTRARDVPLADHDPDDGARSAGDARLDLEAALALLPESQRSALLLRVDAGLSYAEIGAALGATLAQVRMWIFRARRFLAERMLGESRAKEVGRVV
jgi:RNA polymerase sigma-70 factor (ECF subfamily)